jgi:uncharacterized protein with PIN domain
MGQARVCDKCNRILKYAPDTKIKIYVHPYGDMHYELCTKCTEELKTWLNSDNLFNK